MSGDVKPRRPYASPRRREQAAQTRRDLISAAERLFTERGYGQTSMPQIAAEGGVVVETIYRIFGSKAGLFKAVVEAAVAGGAARANVPVEERPVIRAVIDEPDPVRQLELYAATQPGIHLRSGPLLRALLGAAASDPELRTLWHEIEERRLTGQARLVGLLSQRGALLDGLSVEAASDILWTLCSLAVHDLLVGDRGWTTERYEAWLARALVRELLG